MIRSVDDEFIRRMPEFYNYFQGYIDALGGNVRVPYPYFKYVDNEEVFYWRFEDGTIVYSDKGCLEYIRYLCSE